VAFTHELVDELSEALELGRGRQRRARRQLEQAGIAADLRSFMSAERIEMLDLLKPCFSIWS
jgi:hypothetical protein